MSANPNMGARQQHPGQQAMAANFPNGNLSGMPMNASGVPQAQMQATMQNNQRMPPPDQVRMAMQRAQYPATNQHHFQMQQQQLNMSSNLGANMNMANGLPNANMMASMANPGMSGNMNASMNGTPNTAGSPRMNQVNAQMQSPARPLSSGHMPHLLQIQNSLKALNPDWTTEQVQKTASDQLSRHLAKQRAQALGAATGAASGMTPSPQIGNNVYLQSGGMQATPPPNSVQTYQNQLLQQQRMLSQQRQQQAPSPAMSARPMSRSATPQNPQQQQGMQSPNGPPQMRP
jgi:chromatin modification-related protein VID21